MKGYNMKKRVIAFVLAIAVIFGSTGLGNWMGIVLAEGYTNPKLVTVTQVELLNQGSTEVTPGVLRFQIAGRAQDEVEVTEIALMFTGENQNQITLVYSYEDSTSFWRPGTTGSAKQFSVMLPGAVGNQKFQLTGVRLVSTGVNNYYTYYHRPMTQNGYSDVLYGNLIESTGYDPIQFVYDKKADFTVIGSQSEDHVPPLIQSIERILPAAGETIDSETDITYRVNYVEEGSGLQKIQVAFYNGSNWDTCNKDFEAPYRGELTLTSWGRQLGNYEINYIDVIDYAQNQIRYSWREYNGVKTFGYEQYTLQGYSEFVPVGEDFFINGADSYTAALPTYEGLKVTSMNVEADELASEEGRQLHAGTTYMAHVTVENAGTQSTTVDPTKLCVAWYGDANDNSWNPQAYGAGEIQTLLAGESTIIQVPFTVNRFWSALDFELQSISLNFNEEEYTFDIRYMLDFTQNGECLNGYNNNGACVDVLDKSACQADYTVIPGAYMDTVAPVLASITSTAESFTAPGRATLQITMSDEGNAKFDQVEFMIMTDVEDTQNSFPVFVFSNPTYEAVGNGIYRYSFDLSEDVIEGTYTVQEIVFYDEAGNYRDYIFMNDKLVDVRNDQHQTDACRIQIHSNNANKDYDYPILKDMQLNMSTHSVQAGDQIEFEIEVEDESGISAVRLDYMTGAGSDYLCVDTNSGTTKIEEIPALNSGCKRYRIKAWTEKYCFEEAYKLTSIVIWDDSSRQNVSFYNYDGINDNYVLVSTANDEQPILFSTDNELGLVMRLPQGMYLAKVDDIRNAIQTLPNDANTLVVTREAEEDVSLLGTDLADKNVNIIVPDASETSEIQISSDVFKGSDGLDNLILNIQRDDMVQSKETTGNAEDMYYPVRVVSSENNLAVVLCIRLDEEFLSQCEGKEIAIYDSQGNLIQSDLTVNARGEVTVELESLGRETATPMRTRGVTLKTHEFRIASKKADADEVALEFSGASLTLYNDISINYKVSKTLLKENGYINPYVEFVLNGKKTIVKSYRVDGDKYIFDFGNLAPNQMNDIIYATLYATKAGELHASEVTQYSVSDYCYNMLEKYGSKEGYGEFCTLLVDLLNYGAASQEYTDYNVDALANASLTEEQKAWATAEMRELSSAFSKEYETISNPAVAWKGASLKLEDSVTIRFTIETEDISNMVAVIRCGEQQWSIEYDRFVDLGNNRYYVYFEGLNAAQMSDVVYATITQDNVVISNTVAYSIESYAYSKLSNTDTTEALKNILETMMKYGDAAKAYLDSISN